MKKIISLILAILLCSMLFSLSCLAAENAEGKEENKESKEKLPYEEGYFSTIYPNMELVFFYDHYSFEECMRLLGNDERLWYDTYVKKFGDFVCMDLIPVGDNRDHHINYLVEISDDIYIQVEKCTHCRWECKEDFDLIRSTVEKRNLKDMTKIFPDEVHKGPPAVFKQGDVSYAYYPKTVADENGIFHEQMTLQYIVYKVSENEFITISLEHARFFDEYHKDESNPTLLDFFLDATTVERAVEYLYSENVSLEKAFPEFFIEEADETSRTDIKPKGFLIGGITAIAVIGAAVPLVVYSVKRKKR